MADLPSGTVTFLLTDVEASTALWEQAPEAMRAALVRHDALFDAAVREHNGVHIRPRGEGDSRFAVFTSAPDAVAAALAIQRAFVTKDWPTPWPVRVRIGIHTGEAELRDGDYYGSAVNRCARLRNIGHGGQTLLSEATAALVRDHLPDGASLRDLGIHGLRHLQRPEHVFQLTHAELSEDFPPLASIDGRPRDLPVQPTPLLGREREVQAVRGLLLRDDVRLVTLTGPGGVGKTRLALQVAADLLDRFPDGVVLVPLAPISDPELVISAVAQAFGLRETGGRSFWDTLTSYLKEKRLLLVLDNFEQVLPAAPQVADLLMGCPCLTILVTSRAVLRLRAEHEYEVPPLDVPAPERVTSADALSQYAAVTLFAQRAVAVRSDFRVTDENAPAVVEICRRLDGLPLAIELAAARTRLLLPQALLARLERRLPLLTGGARDLPARHQTLRDAITWSYDLLTPAEQALFRRVAIFVGGCTVAAVQKVCDPGHDLGIDVLDGLASLVDKSLLRLEDGPDGEPRFGMLETIREYGLECLETSAEFEEVRRCHAWYYVGVAETTWSELHGPNQVACLNRLEAEHDNLRAALVWYRASSDDPEAGLRLAGALYQFWWRRGHLSEGREWLQVVLSQAPARSCAARARALNAAGVLARAQGDYTFAWSCFDQSLAIFREQGNRWGVANALHNLASIAGHHGDYTRADTLLEQSLAVWRELGDQWGIAMSLSYRGEVARSRGDYRRAEMLWQENLALSRGRGDTWAVASALNDLGLVADHKGDYERAAALLTESVTLYRTLADQWGTTRALIGLGRVARHEGDYCRASQLLREALLFSDDLSNRGAIARCLEELAGIAAEQRQAHRAALLFGASEALREATGLAIRPAERARYEQQIRILSGELEEKEFARISAEGRRMPLEQAVAYALEEQPSA